MLRDVEVGASDEREVEAVERTCLPCNARVGNLNAGRATFTSQTTACAAVQQEVQITDIQHVAQGAQLNLVLPP